MSEQWETFTTAEPSVQVQMALDTMSLVVGEHGPDYVYGVEERGSNDTECVYVGDDNQPSCLVAHVLYRLGLSVDRLADGEGLSVIGNYLKWDFSFECAEVLAAAQMVQDKNYSWGEALENARRQAHALTVA